MPTREHTSGSSMGPSIDRAGVPVVDPTKNVGDLVLAAISRQDDLREAESKYQEAMRAAETRRLNELAAQKQTFDLELARVLRANVDASTLILATQLKEVKNDLSDRVSKLEQFRWESGGTNSGRAAVWTLIASIIVTGISAVGILITILKVSNAL